MPSQPSFTRSGCVLQQYLFVIRLPDFRCAGYKHLSAEPVARVQTNPRCLPWIEGFPRTSLLPLLHYAIVLSLPFMLMLLPLSTARLLVLYRFSSVLGQSAVLGARVVL
ncbi:hypothetical protein Aduo_005682 [Ancylostoma duodenale]